MITLPNGDHHAPCFIRDGFLAWFGSFVVGGNSNDRMNK